MEFSASPGNDSSSQTREGKCRRWKWADHRNEWRPNKAGPWAEIQGSKTNWPNLHLNLFLKIFFFGHFWENLRKFEKKIEFGPQVGRPWSDFKMDFLKLLTVENQKPWSTRWLIIIRVTHRSKLPRNRQNERDKNFLFQFFMILN